MAAQRREGAEGEGGPEGWRAPRSKPRKSGEARQWETEGREAQHFAFFPFPLQISPFVALSGVFSWNCGPCSRPWTSLSVRLGFSGIILCELHLTPTPTFHFSLFTFHLSTYHLSPLTVHLSPFTCHLSPFTLGRRLGREEGEGGEERRRRGVHEGA